MSDIWNSPQVPGLTTSSYLRVGRYSLWCASCLTWKCGDPHNKKRCNAMYVKCWAEFYINSKHEIIVYFNLKIDNNILKEFDNIEKTNIPTCAQCNICLSFDKFWQNADKKLTNQIPHGLEDLFTRGSLDSNTLNRHLKTPTRLIFFHLILVIILYFVSLIITTDILT